MNISEEDKKQIVALQELLQKTCDALAGYKLVKEKATIGTLKEWLDQKMKRRAHFATELGDLIRKLDGTPVADVSALGLAHRGWIDLKSALNTNTDLALMEECLRGEETSLEEYQIQLSQVNFNAETKSVLYGQKESIQYAIQKIASIEDLLQ